MINQILYKKLIETAKVKTTIYYGEVANICNLDLNDPNDRHNVLCEMLGDISTYEHENKRHMLSVVVVLKNIKPRIAGSGFFELAIELGKKQNQTNEEFFRDELKRVYDYWENHDK